MRICAFSDMHGQLDFEIKPCDLVLIGGDVVPLNIQSYTDATVKWFKNTFIPWCTNLPCDKAIFVGGNHDWTLDRHPEKIRELLEGQDKIIYLDCETYEYKGIRIFGTPMCKIFMNWAFMKSYEEQDKIYKELEEKLPPIDIVLSHDAPYGVSDVILQKDCWWADGSHIGNESLRRFIETVKPKILFKGHLHSTSREVEMLGKTKVYSVSLLDENYKMSFEPLYLDIDPKNVE